MFKKEFFGILLLVSMVSSIMFAGFVSSGGGPQLSVKPTAGTGDSQIDWIKGTGWTPNTPVITLFWDQQDLNHTIANVTADRFGKFEIEDLEVEGSYIGAHTIIARQGATTATALYTMKVTTTPDDRILGPIQQLEDKLDNTTSGLPGIQSNFTTVLTNIADIEAKLDNKTSGLPGIQSNLTKIDSDVNAVEGKLDPSGRLGNTTQFDSRGGFGTSEIVGETGYVENCTASKTAEFTVTFQTTTTGATGQDLVGIIATFDGAHWYSVSEGVVAPDYTTNGTTITVAARGVAVTYYSYVIAGNVQIYWGISVEAKPGVTLTWTP